MIGQKKSHLKPDQENNTCNHCYRTLNYETPKVDEILESRKNLPWYHRPFDAPLLWDLENSEINSQKTTDWFKGLTKIMNELKEGELKI